MYNALIVDDDKAVHYILKRSELFRKNGFIITGKAANGKEALEKINESHYDIVLVDIKMPKINGIQFIQELRNVGNEICIVIISGSDDFTYTRQAIKLGAFDYLLKPIANNILDELLTNASSYLHSKKINKNIEKNASSKLAESLMIPYSKQEELQLYQLIIRNPPSCVAYAQDITKRLFDFYNRDAFKLSIVLDNSLINLMQMLVSEMPWLANLQLLDQTVHLQQFDNIYLLEDAYINQIELFSQQILKLHLFDSNSVVKLLCEYITSNIDRKITLETAAEALNYSKKYLGKLFKECTGENIVDYITKVKMERAKKLVRSGKYKNYEVTDILGYKNPDYFTKLFKAHYGYTPLEYRKSTAI
ncbi:MAG: hypothetical protein CVV02_05765 [Firmicutes bacterium HGW-Firmicutes-7]|nr:MAG: hypothetical protein CVV02_05765 [Firmicutes bacterium HGW-Firmicutes-7]